jgi:hypothetical protein
MLFLQEHLTTRRELLPKPQQQLFKQATQKRLVKSITGPVLSLVLHKLSGLQYGLGNQYS